MAKASVSYVCGNAAAPTANGLADVITAGRGTRWLKNVLKLHLGPSRKAGGKRIDMRNPSHSRIPLPAAAHADRDRRV